MARRGLGRWLRLPGIPVRGDGSSWHLGALELLGEPLVQVAWGWGQIDGTPDSGPTFFPPSRMKRGEKSKTNKRERWGERSPAGGPGLRRRRSARRTRRRAWRLQVGQDPWPHGHSGYRAGADGSCHRPRAPGDLGSTQGRGVRLLRAGGRVLGGNPES